MDLQQGIWFLVVLESGLSFPIGVVLQSSLRATPPQLNTLQSGLRKRWEWVNRVLRVREGFCNRLMAGASFEVIPRERPRFAHQKPLGVVDAKRAHGLQLRIQFHGFGDGLDAEVRRHAHDR